ncbi:MAG: DUF2569 family protein [Sphingomicrobium sp.]
MAIKRLSVWVLRLVATIMLFAGVSALVAGGFLFGLPTGIPVLKMIVGIIIQIAGLFAIAGGVATFLSRSRRPLLPNEQMTATGDERPAVGGWLLLLALALVALPIGLVLSVQEFLAGWSELTRFLDSAGLWEGANANMSGVVLIPLAGALSPALLEWSALAMFIIASVILLLSLFARSPGFPRAYLAWGVLLAAVVIACVRSADAVMATGQALQPYLAAENGAVDETAVARDAIGRYAAIVGSTASFMVWALCFYLIWLPAILFSRRARATFAPSAQSPDTESITRHPRTGL